MGYNVKIKKGRRRGLCGGFEKEVQGVKIAPK